ncbi:MAG TPA: hypothetical protein VFM18_22430 [Methanosarcina sp.]|nr:hypothetical protein [Methanosarcina sp.]
MICYYDRYYGCDIYGEHGSGRWECELEPKDEPEILRQLFKQLVDQTETEKVVELEPCVITMINPYTEYDVEFDVEPKDFISQKEWDEFRVKDA